MISAEIQITVLTCACTGRLHDRCCHQCRLVAGWQSSQGKGIFFLLPCITTQSSLQGQLDLHQLFSWLKSKQSVQGFQAGIAFATATNPTLSLAQSPLFHSSQLSPPLESPPLSSPTPSTTQHNPTCANQHQEAGAYPFAGTSREPAWEGLHQHVTTLGLGCPFVKLGVFVEFCTIVVFEQCSEVVCKCGAKWLSKLFNLS